MVRLLLDLNKGVVQYFGLNKGVVQYFLKTRVWCNSLGLKQVCGAILLA